VLAAGAGTAVDRSFAARFVGRFPGCGVVEEAASGCAVADPAGDVEAPEPARAPRHSEYSSRASTIAKVAPA
jgi:hypothetical protein